MSNVNIEQKDIIFTRIYIKQNNKYNIVASLVQKIFGHGYVALYLFVRKKIFLSVRSCL